MQLLHLAVPTSLTVTPANQYSGANNFLSWAADANAISYNIFRSDDKGVTFALLANVQRLLIKTIK